MLKKILGSQEDLIKIIQVMSNLNTIRDVDSLLSEILNSAVILIDAEAGSIILKEKETGFFTIKAAIGDKAEQFKGIKIPVDKGLVGWTIQNNTTLLISDVAKDNRWYNKSDKETGFQTKSIICVPLSMDDMVFGAIEVLNKRNGGYYDDRDEQILTILGTIASTTIYNLILFKELEESKKKIETIINGMADAVMLLDKQNKVTVSNPAADAIFNNAAKSGYLNALDMLVSEISTNTHSDVLDVVLLKPEGAILSCKTTYLKNADDVQEGTILALRNITKIKEKERRKSELLILIAYQLKEPMEKLLLQQKVKAAAADTIFQKKQELYMLKNIEFVSELITKLTYYSHMDTGPMRLERKLQQVSPMLEQVISKTREFASTKNIQIQGMGDTGLKLKFDLETISETLKNLVTDSMIRSVENSIITLRFDEQPEEILIIVEDEGPGFSDEEKDRLFSLDRQIDKFMESETELKDLNLTHAFANYILSAHGGFLEITHVENKNLTTIHLPKD